jgi:ATP-dependent DNA helicase DinG
MTGISAIFAEDGPLARALEGFRARPAQQQMAARISAALKQQEVLLVEAGTGTGKTFAYLVPALLSGRRVLISTGTRTLQDQLYHRDLPLLCGALGRPASVALLKGRSNYLCRARLEQQGPRQPDLPALADPMQERVVEWSLRTRSGDLAELPELSDSHPLRLQISSTRENCAGTRCAHYANCHVFEARRAALAADIVVVNHHLLLADMALKEDGFGDLLPSVDAVILDEAHQLPDLASEFFGVSLSSRQVELLGADLRAELKAQGLEAREAGAPLLRLEHALADCLKALGGEEQVVAWRELGARGASALQELHEALGECGGTWGAGAPSPGLEQCGVRARLLAAAMQQLLDESGGSEAPAGARTASTHARGFLLRLLPYEISTRFTALLAAHPSAWIFTSATLAVGEDFGHFARRLGLQDAPTLRFESPFDYERQALLYLPRGLPSPSSAEFTPAVIATALPLLEAAGGGAFLLFTSHRALRAAAQLLEHRLPAHWPLLVQGRAPREQLLRRFRASGRAVLLGSASFWEGVDVQGPALRLVLIDRLPFASPEDPIVRARIEHLQSEGASPFKEYQLPEAVLALKQGVGRLIRSEDDRGVVVVCDPRLSERGYGRVFRSSLPPLREVREQAPVLALLRELSAAAAGGAVQSLPA